MRGCGGRARPRSPGRPSKAAGRAVARSCRSAAQHQAGIVTPAQDRLHFAAFDLGDRRRPAPSWSPCSRRGPLRQRRCAPATRSASAALPTGRLPHRRPTPARRWACPPANLTLTVGFGTSPVRHRRQGRPASAWPPGVRPSSPTCRAFAGDALDPATTGGDLCVQACADDPQVAVHAIRNLARIARGTASVRYSQLGFGRTSLDRRPARRRRAT